MQVSGSDA